MKSLKQLIKENFTVREYQEYFAVIKNNVITWLKQKQRILDLQGKELRAIEGEFEETPRSIDCNLAKHELLLTLLEELQTVEAKES